MSKTTVKAATAAKTAKAIAKAKATKVAPSGYMRIGPNIQLRPSGTYRVRVCGESCKCSSIKQAYKVRNILYAKHGK